MSEYPTVHAARRSISLPPMALYDIAISTLDGRPSSLAPYQGKTLLLVNVASKCGLTPQYEGLEKLQKTYEDQGFSVLGFPCNQFLEQEPGTADEIAQFCSVNYGVTFPLFEKIEVNGKERAPLYKWLTSEEATPADPGPVAWNFEKFLVGRDGKVIARFRSPVRPSDPKVVEAIEAALKR